MVLIRIESLFEREFITLTSLVAYLISWCMAFPYSGTTCKQIKVGKIVIFPKIRQRIIFELLLIVCEL